MIPDPHSSTVWNKELQEKTIQIEQHLRSNPFYKPRPPRPVPEAESTTNKIEKDVERMEAELLSVNMNVQTLEKQLMKLESESANKSMCDKAKSLEFQSLKQDCKNLETWKPSIKNEQILRDLRLRLTVLRNLTQVKFDFPNCSDDTVSGYVFNCTTKKLKPFDMDKSSLSQAEVITKIIELKECVSSQEQ